MADVHLMFHKGSFSHETFSAKQQSTSDANRDKNRDVAANMPQVQRAISKYCNYFWTTCYFHRYLVYKNPKTSAAHLNC